MTLIVHSEKVFIMRIFLSLLILIFTFQSWAKADDISDIEIEGISIGESLLNYFSENEEWKCQYYEHFLQIDCNDSKEYDVYLKKVCKNFLESLVFTMDYYITGVPAWQFGYKYRCAPFISDLLLYVKSVPNSLNITLEKGSPYTPLQQLFMVVPPQANNLVPKSYAKLMTDIDSPLIQYFPTDFDLDVVMGEKHIYSEPIIPHLNDKKIIAELKDIKLTKTEKERDTLKEEPIKIII